VPPEKEKPMPVSYDRLSAHAGSGGRNVMAAKKRSFLIEVWPIDIGQETTSKNLTCNTHTELTERERL